MRMVEQQLTLGFFLKFNIVGLFGYGLVHLLTNCYTYKCYIIIFF
jgi:hypothetical protein